MHLSTEDFFLILQTVNDDSNLVLSRTPNPYGLDVARHLIPFDGRPVIFKNMFHDEDKKAGIVHNYTNAHEASCVPIFSRGIYKELRDLDYYATKFVPAVIRSIDEKYVENYYAVNTFGSLDVLDFELSEFDPDVFDEDGNLILKKIKSEITRVVFSQEKLSKINPKHLTIFRVEHFGDRVFVSREVKALIEKHPPLDIGFIQMSTWTPAAEM
ncbi:imm11 family protein [Photobacterium nomapromontoriensis]|uniref:imm11 family protein n=1 Tax=Photobacterium nomapromontoriensis TaxID=2910237 RepID=UPI003D0A82D7